MPSLTADVTRKALAACGLVAFCCLCLLAAATSALKADDLTTNAPIAYLVEPKSGSILFAKERDRTFAPGSLTKVMTAATVFKALSDGEISDDRLCAVSEHAWRTGGAPSRTSTMFAAIKSEIPVIDLLRGLLIHNANDAAIILAECLDGSEAAFAKRMNDHARSIGMDRSRFVNPTGFEPEAGEPGSETSARDLTLLAEDILIRHSDYYGLFSEPEFTWNRIFQRNKSPLLGEIRDLDGLGAGQSDADGYSALVSVERGGRRVIAVVAGLESDKARLAAVRRLIEGAWTFFQVRTLYAKGETVADARVHDGTQATVPLTPVDDVAVLLPNGETLDYRLRVVYSGPLVAPVEAGVKVGELRVLGRDGIVHRTPLITGGDVPRAELSARAIDGLKELLFGWL
ncbi:D-alanyl-D-alanine carboxypeptidase family protein [Roseibium sp.]|uniref:D-alanyl-D-alanine carboxypeptidase family protein n=1 Tax=Roseibium sp. TaxID=1936156 RepID=UPI003A9834A2